MRSTDRLAYVDVFVKLAAGFGKSMGNAMGGGMKGMGGMGGMGAMGGGKPMGGSMGGAPGAGSGRLGSLISNPGAARALGGRGRNLMTSPAVLNNRPPAFNAPKPTSVMAGQPQQAAPIPGAQQPTQLPQQGMIRPNTPMGPMGPVQNGAQF